MRMVSGIIDNDILNNLNNSYQTIENVGNQLSSGKQLNKPSDNPSGVSVAIDMHAAVAANKQYVTTSGLANDWLTSTNSAMQQLTDVAMRARTLTVQAANDSNTQQERTAISNEISQLVQQTQLIGNSSYGGSYLFGGTQVQTPPFTTTGGFQGNSGAIMHQLAPGYSMRVNTDPTTIFSGTAGMFNTLNQLLQHLTSTGEPIAPPNAGSETMALSGNYTGAANTSYLVKVNTLNATNTAVNDVVVSTDGGATWGAPIPLAGVPPTVALGNGISANFIAGPVNPQVGDQFSFNTGTSAVSTSYAIANGANVGNETATVTGTYNGQTVPAYIIKPTTLDTNNNIVGAQFSIDNGATWTNVTATGYDPTTPFAAGTATSFDLGNGQTLTLNQSTVNAGRVVLNGDKLSVTPTTTGLNSDLSALDAIIGQISGQQAQLGTQQNAVQSNISQLQAQGVTLSQGLSQIEDSDMAALATKMASAQNLYQATLQVDAKSVQQTLMDFLK